MRTWMLALTTAAAGVACSSGPDAPTVGPGGATRYTLRIVAAETCPTSGAGVMSRSPFEFEIVDHTGSRQLFALREPFNQQPNTGDLTLRLAGRAAVAGELGGFGLSSNGVETLGVWATRERTGPARVEGVAVPGGGFEGTFSGYVTYSVFRTAGGGECTATAHSWRLSPRG